MKNKELKLSEFATQCLVIEYLEILKAQGKIVMFTSIPNATWTPSWGQKIKNKKAGLNPGFPDLIILTKTKAFCIELKVHPNKTTEQQREWHMSLNRVGISTWTAFSYEAAKECIDSELCD